MHPNGNIEADTDACKKHGIAAVRVKRTIKILRLNVERLRLAREKRWNALSDNWKADFDNPQVMEAAARGELLPNEDGGLLKFFTTNRSYFAPLSENILAKHPQAWI